MGRRSLDSLKNPEYIAFSFDIPISDEKRWGYYERVGWSNDLTLERVNNLSDKGILDIRYQGPSEEEARKSIKDVVELKFLPSSFCMALEELP